MAHVDKVMGSSYGFELVRSCPHGCKRENDGTPVQVENINNIDKTIDCEWHKLSYVTVNAKLM